MKKLIGLMALVLSMVFFSGCSGSGDNGPDGDGPVLKFTPELLVGKTYRATDDEGTFTVTFHEDGTLTFETGDGETGTLTYTIDEDGHLVIDDEGEDDIHILISIEENGDLRVENDGIVILWKLVSDEDDDGEKPELKFTPELLVGMAYQINDSEGSVTATFSDTTVTIEEDGSDEIYSYEIDGDGRLIINGNDIHTLISKDGDILKVKNDGMVSTWSPLT